MWRLVQPALRDSATRLRESMSQKRILFIGPVMPPKGGVSVHIERLAMLLSNDFDISFLDESRQIKESIPNIRKMSPLTYVNIIRHADVVHVHSFSGLLKLLHVLFSRILRKRVVLTVHSVLNSGVLSRCLLTASSKFAHTVVAVSDRVGQSVHGTPKVIPAFIPPDQSELTTSSQVAKWISDRKAEGRVVFASNAYRLERYQGDDLYGLDLIIDAFANDAVSRRCACIFVLAAPDEAPEPLQKYKGFIAQRRMEGFFLLHTEPENFPGVAALADGTIRATSYDGDALSIRESLHLGKVTLASDAAVRPQGTRTFKSRDVHSLIATILSSAQELATIHPAAPSMQTYRDLYVALYGDRRRSAAD